MRDRLIELLNKQSCPSPLLCDKNCKYAHLESCYAERVADYLLENGVIVPPCKVGDIVYRIVDGFNYPLEYKVTEVHIHSFAYIEVKEIGIQSKCGKFGDIIGFSDFGKTVFLTKEEAEAALKGGAE